MENFFIEERFFGQNSLEALLAGMTQESIQDLAKKLMLTTAAIKGHAEIGNDEAMKALIAFFINRQVYLDPEVKAEWSRLHPAVSPLLESWLKPTL